MFPAILLLILGLWSAAATINAFRPFRQTLLLFPSMFWSWLVIGLPIQHVVAQMVVTGLLIWWGALDHILGWIGLVFLVASWIGSLVLLLKTRRSKAVVDHALAVHDISRSGKSGSDMADCRRCTLQGTWRREDLEHPLPDGGRPHPQARRVPRSRGRRPTAPRSCMSTVAVGPSVTNASRVFRSSTTWPAMGGSASRPTTGSAPAPRSPTTSST